MLKRWSSPPIGMNLPTWTLRCYGKRCVHRSSSTGETCWILIRCGNSDSIITLLDARACDRNSNSMAQRSARETALAALWLWREKRCFADSIISGLLANADLTASDRAFAVELFYGSLRNLTLLDFWISRLRASRIETNLRDILRLGLYQVFILKTAEHAAVHETVAIAPQNQRPIVNAILRAATRQRHELLANADAQPLSVRTSHPQFLVERWRQHFGADQAEELCNWNNQPAPIYGRINLLKIDPGIFLQLYPDTRRRSERNCCNRAIRSCARRCTLHEHWSHTTPH